MPKPLSELTLEELWQLFPIIVTEHRAIWADWYAEEAAALRALLPDEHITLHHVGSTAIRGIHAKPIVDILLELPTADDLPRVAAHLSRNGWITMNRQPTRIDLNKGYTPEGFAEKVYHLHLRILGDHDEVYFRDYLGAHPDVAAQYEALKLSLAPRYKHDRDGYTAAKTDFVRKYTALAKSSL